MSARQRNRLTEHGKMYIHTETLFYRTLTNRQRNFDKRKGSDASAEKNKKQIFFTHKLSNTKTRHSYNYSKMIKKNPDVSKICTVSPGYKFF